MKVALYARVSTQRQEKQGTISSQVAALRRYAQEHHYTVAEEYVFKDEGLSGAFVTEDLWREGRVEAFINGHREVNPIKKPFPWN